ncbi:alpha/beta hydrolase [Aeromonas popoffii]|uniref:Alpha/beta hydrolase n=1 Tax=Aeromonas popoffii TaxID=70856 RepID=A0ABS5GKA2_9GAMM|nr:alpha/beta hydrolase [Aeromonas popoffii]MBR7627560.1 alpha/beta hydrolase [Aeromonas popoffii]
MPSIIAATSVIASLSIIALLHEIKPMIRATLKTFKWAALVLGVSVLTILGVRAYDSQRGAPLELWHTFVPHELTVEQIDMADWAQYVSAEERIFAEVRTEVSDRLDPESRNASDRYFVDSPIYPGNFANNWNHSYIMMPMGTPIGAVVLLHGLTDSPYSLRHIALRYQADGYVVVAARMPGHGTVPGGLTKIEWQQWAAATRMAAREARRLGGASTPLHVIGFSNGGALAMNYALEALSDKALARPDRIVLISPMIGITSMARFAGMMGWPAVFPAFAKASWLNIVPEFNPFKYNSFPVNAARQTALMSNELQQRIARYESEGRLSELAPILTFQSVVDFTVSTRAIINALYAHLPANGSELVLFDINRNTKIGPLLRVSNDTVLKRLLPAPPRAYTATVISNISPNQAEVMERTTPAGSTKGQTRALGLVYPREVFSLSHLALPFPLDDSLYGLTPGDNLDYGVNLGAMAARGERGTLIVSMDSLTRMSSNPFFSYMLKRIEEGLGGGRSTAAPSANGANSPE